ncbi:MAG: alpha/beta fold hydrolase [Candidatus Omnitrophica bacterium]|nr:alpha/beta fold hydrolase [Candidatus Omnitrophota bacterium]
MVFTMQFENYQELGIKEIQVHSTIDNSKQPSLLWLCNSSDSRQLLVGLHTWSADRYNQIESLYPLAKKNGWHLLLPEFRGPNLKTNPRATQACASIFAMQDVIDAINAVCLMADIEKNKIFLIGGSGGGHMALMLAGYCPEMWRSVASFCPITDLIAWHKENLNYSPHIEACCGGPPDENTIEEYKKRSPIFYADKIAQCKQVYIYHGKFDRSVPFTHSLNLFNKICQINPKANVFLEIFDGGHEMIIEKAEVQFMNSCQDNSAITG